MTVNRRGNLIGSHREHFLHTATGELIKLDLLQDYYRLLYGATLSMYKGWILGQEQITSHRTFADVFETLLHVANVKGHY